MVLREEQNSAFPKTFFGGHLFVFVEYLCNRSPKIKTKNIKNYSSILAIVNHRNWLDDSPTAFKNSLLNEQLLKGPNYAKNLVEVLLHLRQKLFAFACDIVTYVSSSSSYPSRL